MPDDDQQDADFLRKCPDQFRLLGVAIFETRLVASGRHRQLSLWA